MVARITLTHVSALVTGVVQSHDAVMVRRTKGCGAWIVGLEQRRVRAPGNGPRYTSKSVPNGSCRELPSICAYTWHTRVPGDTWAEK